jgi:hypothetical protein
MLMRGTRNALRDSFVSDEPLHLISEWRAPIPPFTPFPDPSHTTMKHPDRSFTDLDGFQTPNSSSPLPDRSRRRQSPARPRFLPRSNLLMPILPRPGTNRALRREFRDSDSSFGFQTMEDIDNLLDAAGLR